MLTELLRQFDVLGQGPNLEDWGDFLVIAILAVLWLAGVLAKVVGSRRRPQQPRRQEGLAMEQPRPQETWRQRLAHKAEEIQQAVEAQRRQVEQEASARAETREQPSAGGSAEPVPPSGGRIAVRPRGRGDEVIVYERPAPQHVPSQRQEQAARQRETRKAIGSAARRATRPASVGPPIEIARPGAESRTEKLSGVLREPPKPLAPDNRRPQARETTGFHADAIIDYGDPDTLRKAILHYEILGKPIALRESSDEPSSF